MDYKQKFEEAERYVQRLTKELNALQIENARLENEVRELEIRYNPNHDPTNGRFTDSTGGGAGAVLYVGKGEKGNGAYVVNSDKFGKQKLSANAEDIERAESIKNEFIEKGLNSNFAGIRKRAEEGSGSYAYKDAAPVTAKEAENIVGVSRVHEKNGKTLIEGYFENGSHVYYANSSDSPEIKNLLKKRENKNVDVTLRRPDMTGKITTTYDTWLKKKRKKFDDWYGVAGE